MTGALPFPGAEAADRDAAVLTPLDDYTLVDFGGGRRLERLGPYLVDRPAPQARGATRVARWRADWVYRGERVATGIWEAVRGGLAPEWPVTVDGQAMHCRLARGGQVGLYPEHVACWRWLRARVAGCPGARVLNLFAASGGATVAALAAGAAVTHVDAQQAAMSLARVNAPQGARWLREDVMVAVQRLLRRGERFEVIVLDPPSYGRGPKGQTWSLARDLSDLVAKLPGLLAERPLGIWLSAHTPGWEGPALGQLLRDAVAGAAPRHWRLGVVAIDGRVLPGGHAATWDGIG